MHEPLRSRQGFLQLAVRVGRCGHSSALATQDDGANDGLSVLSGFLEVDGVLVASVALDAAFADRRVCRDASDVWILHRCFRKHLAGVVLDGADVRVSKLLPDERHRIAGLREASVVSRELASAHVSRRS